MNDLKNTPTADLIAEWGKIKKDDLVIEDVCLRWNAIAAELDRRCSNANMESDGNGNLKTPCSIELPLAEFCLLCEWLIIKDGGKP